MNKKLLFIILGGIGVFVVILIVAGIIVFNTFFNKEVVSNGALENLVKDTSITSSVDNVNTSSGTKACDILTLDMAKSILNNDMVILQTDSDDDDTCTYASQINNLGEYDMLIFVISQTSPTQARSDFELAKNVAYSASGETVNVNGADDAYWVSDIYQLSVLKDSNWFILSGLTGGDEKETLTNAAQQIINKL